MKNALKEARLKRGLTLAQASERVGLAAMTIWRHERGDNLSAEAAKAYHEAYGISLGDLLGIDKRRPSKNRAA